MPYSVDEYARDMRGFEAVQKAGGTRMPSFYAFNVQYIYLLLLRNLTTYRLTL